MLTAIKSGAQQGLPSRSLTAHLPLHHEVISSPDPVPHMPTEENLMQCSHVRWCTFYMDDEMLSGV